MRSLSEVEKLAKESRNTAIRSANSLFGIGERYSSKSSKRVELMVDGIITAAMMEIAAMQIKIVEDRKK